MHPPSRSCPNIILGIPRLLSPATPPPRGMCSGQCMCQGRATAARTHPPSHHLLRGKHPGEILAQLQLGKPWLCDVTSNKSNHGAAEHCTTWSTKSKHARDRDRSQHLELHALYAHLAAPAASPVPSPLPPLFFTCLTRPLFLSRPQACSTPWLLGMNGSATQGHASAGILLLHSPSSLCVVAGSTSRTPNTSMICCP